jgi:hypothetical protein
VPGLRPVRACSAVSAGGRDRAPASRKFYARAAVLGELVLGRNVSQRTAGGSSLMPGMVELGRIFSFKPVPQILGTPVPLPRQWRSPGGHRQGFAGRGAHCASAWFAVFRKLVHEDRLRQVKGLVCRGTLAMRSRHQFSPAPARTGDGPPALTYRHELHSENWQQPPNDLKERTNAYRND